MPKNKRGTGNHGLPITRAPIGKHVYVIRDVRNERVYIDDLAMLRNFEEQLDEGEITAMREKYPSAKVI